MNTLNQRTILLFILIFGGSLMYGQSNPILPSETKTKDISPEPPEEITDSKKSIPNDNTIYRVIENQPEFPGGIGEMNKFINDNLIYPDSAKLKNIQGKVIVQFTVEKDGKLTLLRVMRDGVGYGAADEALRIIKSMPVWIPGRQNGVKVRIHYTLPITFKL